MAKDEPRMNTMQVAAKLGCRYQRARDLMLSNKLGKPELEPLTVPTLGVNLYIENQRKPESKVRERA